MIELIDNEIVFACVEDTESGLVCQEILSQHIVLRQEAVTAVDAISTRASSILVGELRFR
jgi:hypothetical protein